MKINKLITLSLITIALLAGCAKADKKKATDSNKTASESQILSIGLTNPVTLFNPLNTPDVQSRWAQRYLYEPLIDMTEPLTFQPRLAESFETTDNETYHIKLNQTAQWTDGQSITADDVLFTYNLFVNPETETNRTPAFSLIEGVGDDGKLSDQAAGLTGVEKINDYELTIKTKQPTDENLVKEFVGSAIFILPKHIWEKADPSDIPSADFALEPTVTSGPYKFVKFEKDAYLELESNDEFYLGEPKIKQIFLRNMTAANLATELSSGGITLNSSGAIGELIVQDIDTLEKNESLDVVATPGINPQVMLYNMDNLEDVAIRQAIALAINREAIVEQLIQGRGEVLSSPFGSEHPYNNPALSPIAYDPEKAKELITSSDFDLSEEIEIIVPLGNSVREQSANLIAADLEKVGFKTKQSTYDFPTLLERGRAGEFHLMLVGYGITIDPDVTSYLSENGTSHYSNYHSAENERLLAEGRQAVDLTEKREIYNQLQDLWIKDLPSLPLYNADFVKAKDRNLKGGIHDFWQGSLSDIHLWEFTDSPD